MKAILKDHRHSPRKMRLIADLVRGKAVNEALAVLKFTDKKASGVFEKLILSAKANAASQGKNPHSLVITSVSVDQGTVLKRYRPRARGVAAQIKRRNSHVRIELAEKGAAAKKGKTKKSGVAQSATQ